MLLFSNIAAIVAGVPRARLGVKPSRGGAAAVLTSIESGIVHITN